MFWTYLDNWIYVTIILKRNNMFCFLNKVYGKPFYLNFEFLYKPHGQFCFHTIKNFKMIWIINGVKENTINGVKENISWP